ncbi:MAG: MerR family transcriptional regulator [Nitrospirae bacterium]|nr:MerR family transcriptional regulator [Nitrospirota bacterium]MBI3593484.1 MerR family transcriptional regulator [Nitrospirota bacterium]
MTGHAKMFYKIGEVSKLTGLESYVLRFWENEFTLLHPRKNDGGQRVYLQKDIELILKIKKMLYEEGYTIAGAKKVLKQFPGQITSDLPLGRIQKELRGILELLH